eukprot:c25163_g1_i1 orf=563-1291(-)
MASASELNSLEPLIDYMWQYACVLSPSARGHPRRQDSPGGTSSGTFNDMSVGSVRQMSRLSSSNSVGTSREMLLARLKSFSDAELEQLRRVFNVFDENCDGRVSEEEFCSWMQKLGLQISEDGMIWILKSALPDKDGSLDFSEFVSVFNSLAQESGDEGSTAGHKLDGKKSEMQEAFELFDKDGNGLISFSDLTATLASMGLLKDDQLSQYKNMIRRMDTDGDGEVSFSEFQRMMRVQKRDQ